jgi:hypothetical protein
MSKDGFKFHCLAEEEYFYDLNHKLIEKIHQEEADKRERELRASHVGKCSGCGSVTEEELIEGHPIKICSHCATMALPLSDFERIVATHSGRRFLNELQIRLRRRSGPRAA